MRICICNKSWLSNRCQKTYSHHSVTTERGQNGRRFIMGKSGDWMWWLSKRNFLKLFIVCVCLCIFNRTEHKYRMTWTQLGHSCQVISIYAIWSNIVEWFRATQTNTNKTSQNIYWCLCCSFPTKKWCNSVKENAMKLTLRK